MTGIRALLARLLPQGAILLSVLTFTAYLAGLVRDRIFARTYGAGIELDAYNAAFVLPELALDVLVAAGLTAPFVPIFTPSNVWVNTKKVHGYLPLPWNLYPYYNDVWLET